MHGVTMKFTSELSHVCYFWCNQ